MQDYTYTYKLLARQSQAPVAAFCPSEPWSASKSNDRGLKTFGHLLNWCLAAVFMTAGAGVASAQSIVDPGQGPTPLVLAVNNPGGLSGVTYTGGNTFRFVSDSGGKGAYANVGLNGATGAINTPSVGLSSPYTYTGGVDLEGIAYAPSDGGVFVSDESNHTIKKYAPAGGASTGSVSVPAIYTQARTNRSLEALSMQPNGQSLWTANEEALTLDGDAGTNSLVRIQKFNAGLNAAGQWAYQTDGGQGGWETTQNSGLVDLAVLPDGSVLSLERAVGADVTNFLTGSAVYRFRNRIYLLDFNGATDVSGESSLDSPSSPYSLVSKTLLWEGFFDTHNFEGMALGPALDSPGDYSLLLVSDDDTFPAAGSFPVSIPETPMDQSLYALKLTGVAVPEPGSLLLMLGASVILLRRWRGVTNVS